jgi:hypothetical protein
MKNLIETFFETYDAQIREQGPLLEVSLPDVLREAFGQDTLRLVFRPEDVDESAELVTHGGYVLNTIHSFLQNRGVKVVSLLKERFHPNNDSLLEQLTVENGTIREVTTRKAKTVDVLFNFKCTFLSDEKSERLVGVGVDERGGVFDVGDYYTPEAFDDLESLPHKGRIQLTRRQLEGRFREALRFVSEGAQAHGRELLNDILKRLHRNVSRLKGYYGAQVEELHRNQPTYEEKRLSIEREYEHKLREEIDNHKLRIVLKLISYQIVERSEIEVSWHALHRRGHPRFDHQSLFDCYTGILDHGYCPSCQRVLEQIVLTDDDRIGCHHCVFRCKTCRSVYSEAQGGSLCAVCGDRSCSQCRERCEQCGAEVCLLHSGVCDVGGEALCSNCLKACIDCGRRLCSDHAFVCAGTGQVMCFEHRVICPRCRSVYSSRYVDGLKERRCPQCASPV